MSTGAHALYESDREARRRAQTVFERPFVLEAGAGTGKTTTLVARIVVWAMGSGWERAEAACRSEIRHRSEAAPDDVVAARVLERVVAITFTEAAAAEMAERVGQALASLEQGKRPQGIDEEFLPGGSARRRERARALLDAVDRLVVRTIHAFCRRLLAAHPLEAGMHPRFQVDANGEARAAIVREVVEVHLQRALVSAETPGGAELLALAAEGMGAPEIEAALQVLLESGARPDDLAQDPLNPSRIRALVRELEAALDAFVAVEGGRLQAARRSSLARETSAAVARLRALLREAPVASAAALDRLAAAVRDDLTPSRVKRLAEWAAGELNSEESGLLGAPSTALGPVAVALLQLVRTVSELDTERLARAHSVLRPLLLAAHERLHAAGVAGFADLLRSAHDLLRERPDVVAEVRRGIDLLLVDEFQDTDRLQCEIIAILALAGNASWPSLFLVGDPKQSIYGWRSADLQAYDDFIERVLASGGVRERLSVSRRSFPAILDEVSRLLAPAMQETRGVQPAFAPLVAHPDREKAAREAGNAVAVEHWITAEEAPAAEGFDRPLAARAVALEASSLARDLRDTHAHGVPWREMAVLFRAFSAVPEYLRALEEQGVPYLVDRDRSYAQRREVIEACALARAVLDPHDGVALVAWLRSVCVGVPDAAWIPLWERGFPEHVADLRAPDRPRLDALRVLVSDAVAAIPPDVPGLDRIRGWEEALLDALDALAWLRDGFESAPSDVFVERLRTTFVLEATEGARYLGRFRVANLERFFRELSGWLAEPGAHVAGVLRRLRSIAEPPRGAEEGPAQDAGDDAVRILTIHQAKGLDFGHVYVMQLHHEAGERAGDEPCCAWHRERLEYRLLGAPSLGWGAARCAREAVASAELVRTLYVATTRAKERLVLAGRRPGPAPRAVRSPRSHADLIALGRPPAVLAARAEVAARNGEARFELDGGRGTVLGLLRPKAAPRHAAASSPAGRPDAAAVRADSTQLRLLAQEAGIRAERPFRGAVTEESHAEVHELLAAREFGEPAERTAPPARGGIEPPGSASRAVATAAGTAVHRWLESTPLDGDLAAAFAASEGSIRRTILSLVPPEDVAAVWERTGSIVKRFLGSPLGTRLRALAPHIVARELPVLLAPTGETGPVGFVAGAIDLVYRDPRDGSLVVADWKTDRAEGEARLEELARAYAAQGALYTRALRDALELPSLPRFELWFLVAGRVVNVPPRAGA